VSRYRLQLAQDRNFADIVFDRVVNGLESEINDLDPGRYFWRVAPLNGKLGEFSSAGVIEVRPPPTVVRTPLPAPKVDVPSKVIATGGGWRAAVGSITSAVTANLRSTDKLDLVLMNADGMVSALDATTGVSLWSSRVAAQPNVREAGSNGRILIAANRSGLGNVVILRGTVVALFEGRSGRELARSTLPAPAAAAAIISDQSGSHLVVVDNSRQRLFVLNTIGENTTSQFKLPARVIGTPIVFNDQGKTAFALAYDSGDIEIRDATGAVTRAANVNSSATTGPLFVRGRRGDLILVGTREGLTALTADLRPLGRMAIPNDAPRGTLVAQDLDGDGVAEIIMTTDRRHLVAVNSTDGKILWDVMANDYGETMAFADINGDHVLDIFTAAGQKFAVALSGRDGSVIWKDDEASVLATNHATAFESRGLVAVPFGNGLLLIGAEPARTGCRSRARAPSRRRSWPRWACRCCTVSSMTRNRV
jgi:outer membrane protein assembly factor BamB